MKNVKKLLKSRRLMAGLLCVSMITSSISGFGIASAATGRDGSTDPAKITSGATRQADPSTMDDYIKVLNFENNTRYAGRLWSDKSVFAYGATDKGNRSGQWSNTSNSLQLMPALDGVDDSVSLDADFLHVYSVLGSSVQVNDPVPADLVLALDISGSMNSPEANEDENWINTVDPTVDASFSTEQGAQGLGFYSGSADSITNVSSGVVTSKQSEYKGYGDDSNGIPNAIVPVLPTAGNTGISNGQMTKSTFDTYNAYLTFCNSFADALKAGNVDNDESISAEEATNISNALKEDDSVKSYLDNTKINNLNYTKYTEIYKLYLKYKADADAIKNDNGDPWMSDKGTSAGDARNALWPNENWKKAMSVADVTEPTNPMKNAGNAPNRMYYMINAANSFIDQYLSLNEKNRISVVVYDSVATVLMPLAHYAKAGDADYLSAQKHHWQSWGEGQWACTVKAMAKPTGGYEDETDTFGDLLAGGVYSASVTSWSNTGTVIALNAGLDILANSLDTYDDFANRIPIMVLMTDGAANVAMTGLGDGEDLAVADASITFDKAWTMGSTKSKTKANAPTFNGYDGTVLNSNGANYNMLHDTDAFKNKTSPNLTVYGANYGHIYGSEDDMDIRYAVVLSTLMSTAYQKTLVEKHYNKNAGDSVSEEDERTEANIYTIGFGLDYYGNIEGLCGELLNPKDYFNTTHYAAATQEFKNIYDGYKKWYNATDDGNYTPSFSKSGTSVIDGSTPMPSLTMNFPITQGDLTDTDVTKEDINNNIQYNKEYYSAVLKGTGDENSKTLEGVFDMILGLIQREMFTPVGGANDLGVEDSVTYMDPIGKYMEVKGVKKLLLFGELHDVVKTAIYEYSFNDEYMKQINKQGQGFDDGWYKRDGDEIIKADTNLGESWELAWTDGWEYHVSTATAEQFLPNETDLDIKDPNSKIANTAYTFYRLDMSQSERAELRMNPAFGTTVPTYANITDPNNQNYYTKISGVYRLSDLRIWVEDSGDYSDPDLEGSGVNTDTNFDQALYVNLPVNMLPIRTVVLSPTLKTEGGYTYTYTTNLTEGTAGYLASFPLRVFYTVGVEEEVLTAGRSIDVAKGIHSEYLNENKVNTDDEAAEVGGRNLEVGDLEFFSSWYNPINRYTSYAISDNDYTFGDPVVTFSPDADNRYYVFEKSLPVYSKAFVYSDGKWKPVVIDDTGKNVNGQDTFLPASFGGNLLASDLDAVEGDDDNETQVNILDALASKNIVETKPGDIVLLKNALITDTRDVHRDASNKDFTSGDYYYLALEYYELDENKSAEMVQYVVTRKGSEFGSAYEAAGLSNGELLCWYDASGNNSQIYPYLSASETHVYDRGKSFIGYDYNKIFDADGELKTNITTPDPKHSGFLILDEENEEIKDAKSDADAIRNSGNWVVASKVGGLRVGDLAKDVQSKGGTYTDYNESVKNRYKEAAEGKTLTWHYCDNNITRTANNYYVPTISAATSTGSTGSAAAAAAIVNTYLGNNGRLWISAPSVSLTKTVVVKGEDGEKQDVIDKKEFNYQVYIDGFTDERDAFVLRYDAATDSWQRQLHYIDLELDNSLFLQTKNGNAAMVDAAGKLVTSRTDSDGNISYVYADGGAVYSGTVYNVYIGTNKTPEVTSSTSMRVYHNELVDDYSIREDDITVKNDDNGNEVFSAATVELRPIAGSSDNTIVTLTDFELLTLEPDGVNSLDMVVKSPYRTISSYWSVTLDFGINADDLYDQDNKFNGKELADIAANTAETTLKNGYGLLFTGMEPDTSYRFTEKLTDEEIERGYSLDRIEHVVDGNIKLDSSTDKTTMHFDEENYVYSVFGNVASSFEKSGHYYNLWETAKTETEINGNPVTPPEDDSNTYPSVKVGDKITYQIKWANNTGEKAKVIITDPLDNGVDFVEASDDGVFCKTAAEATETAGFTVTTDRTVVWSLGEKDSNTDGSVTLIVEVNKDAIEYWDYDKNVVGDEPEDFMVRNRATIRVADNEYNTNTVVNPLSQHSKTETAIERGEEAEKLGQGDDLTIDKDDLKKGEDGKLHGPLVFVGDKITYEVEWRNYKNVEATVTIRDPLDDNVKFISASYDPDDTKDKDGNKLGGATPAGAYIDENNLTAGTTNDYGEDTERAVLSYVEANHQIVWNLGNQPAGANGKVTLVVEVLESAIPIGYVDNTGYVQVNGDPEQRTETIENPIPHEEKKEAAPGDGVMVGVGDDITYEINWHNYREVPARVIIMDTLDPGVDFVEASVVDSKGSSESSEEASVNSENAGEGSEIANGKYFAEASAIYINEEGEIVTPEEGQEEGLEKIEIPAHTVVWILEDREANAEGTVTLTVKVNEKAKDVNKYNDSADGFDQNDDDGVVDGKDYEVLNQARVKVENDPFIKTKIMKNPVPEKTETEVAHANDSLTDETDIKLTLKEGEESSNTYVGPLVYVGDVITYEIHWTNGYDVPAKVVITDTLDSGVNFKEAYYLKGNESILGEYDETSHTVTWTLDNQPAGASGVVVLKVEVNDKATAAGVVENTAYVKVGDNPAVKTETIENPTPHEEKTEVKPGDGQMVQIGEEITYEIKWHNYHTDQARVIIMDTLDPGVDFVSASDGGVHHPTVGDTIPALGVGDAPIDIPAHTVVWVLNDRPANEKGTVTLTVKVNENAKDKYTYDENADGLTEGTGKDYEVLNQARVKVGNDEFIKTQIVNNPLPEKTETDVVHADPSLTGDPDIVLTPKEGEENTYVGPLVFVGDEITYKIHWTNGHDEKANVVITDKLDKGVDFVSADNGGIYNEDSHTVTWTLTERDPHADGVVELKVKVNEKATVVGVVENTAQVKVGDDPAVETETIENPTPKEEKEETTPGEGEQVMPGDEIEYEILWHNYHEDEATVIITDKLDPGVDFLSASVEGIEIMLEAVSTYKLEEKTVASEDIIDDDEETDDSEQPEEETDTDIPDESDEENKDENRDTDSSEESDGEGTDGETIETDSPEESDHKDTVGESGESNSPENSDQKEASVEPIRQGNYVLTQRRSERSVYALKAVRITTASKELIQENPEEEAIETGSPEDSDSKDKEGENIETENPDGSDNKDPEGEIGETDKSEDPDNKDTEGEADETGSLDDPESGEGESEVTVSGEPEEETEAQVDSPEKLTIVSDEYGTITIEYDKVSHTVKWTLAKCPEGSEGKVKLKVQVNENAEKLWSYDDPTAAPSETEKDDRVRNQAGVKVGDDPEVKTRVIENPTKPSKTETNINDDDVSRDLVADEDGYVGPDVHVGDTITYKITWQNNASDDEGEPVAAIITITDVLDSGVDFVSASDGGAYDSGTRTVTWALGEQDARARGSVTLTVRVNVNAIAPGQVENEATVTVGNISQQTDKVRNPVRSFGNLRVTKTVAGNAGDTDKEWHFRVELSDKGINGEYGEMTFTNGVAEFTLKHGETKTATGLPAGITYTVTEREANEDGYTTSAEGVTGDISQDTTANATFVNSKDETQRFGSLKVTKTVTGAAGDTDKEWHFRVILNNANINGEYGEMTFTNGVAEFTLKHGESKTATGLPVGITYRVIEEEANEDGYRTTVVGDVGSITEGTTATVEFTNSKGTPPKGNGNLRVTKTVTGTGGDTNKEWHFVVELSDKSINGQYGDMYFTNGVTEFTLKHGESKTAKGLPASITYRVTEREANQDGYQTSSQGITGTIPEGGTAEAKFVNSKTGTPPPEEEPGTPTPEVKYGSLRVTKTVTGTAGDTNRDWNFRVELSDANINGWYGDMFFTNGVAEFTLKHGESKTATGLPAGVTYKVIELDANSDGYTTTSAGEIGTIVSGQVMTSSFVNNRPAAQYNPQTGDNSHMGWWIVMMAISLAGILVSSLALFRGRRDDSEQDMKR